MHFCVNLVCLGNGSASAVLLRAGRIIEGEELARSRRTGAPKGVQGATGVRGDGFPREKTAVPRGVRGDGSPRGKTAVPRGVRGDGSPREKKAIPFRDLARGPARLCQALDIDRSLDGADVCVPESPLRMRWPDASTTARSVDRKILSGPRVGISAAAEVPWRFWVEDEPTVSAYRPAVPRHRKLVTP